MHTLSFGSGGGENLLWRWSDIAHRSRDGRWGGAKGSRVRATPLLKRGRLDRSPVARSPGPARRRSRVLRAGAPVAEAVIKIIDPNLSVFFLRVLRLFRFRLLGFRIFKSSSFESVRHLRTCMSPHPHPRMYPPIDPGRQSYGGPVLLAEKAFCRGAIVKRGHCSCTPRNQQKYRSAQQDPNYGVHRRRGPQSRLSLHVIRGGGWGPGGSPPLPRIVWRPPC